MNLLVLAHIPPPLHGQSVMVQAMLLGLAHRPELRFQHVNFQLSRDHEDIGRWSSAKILRTLSLTIQAIVVRFRHGCDTLYYVPAPPGKRGALYRDWIVMLLCRPFFSRVVLHWHAAGLGAWLESEASGIERLVTQVLLGRVHLAIVLADSLRGDATVLRARKIAVVPNGVPDPGPPSPLLTGLAAHQALFLGLCSEEKGLFAAADAVIAANQRIGAERARPHFTLLAAGPFPSANESSRFRALSDAHPAMLRHVGFAGQGEKKILFAESRCLIFPTRYAAEGLPLVVLEALAHDLPILGTRWRTLPDIVTADCGLLVDPGDTEALAAALLTLDQSPIAPGACRARYLRHFEINRHLDALAAALLDSAAR